MEYPFVYTLYIKRYLIIISTRIKNRRMKLKLYKKIFTFLSFLTDKTEGKASILVKYKLILGSIIVVLANTSCHTNRNPYVTCYDISIGSIPTNTEVVKDTIDEVVNE